MLAELPTSYWCLALLRIALVLVPQLGYIHPDEYFQSIEVLAAKVFEVDSNPPWEFNASFPIRSMTLPYFTIGMAYRLGSLVDYFTNQWLSISIVTPYLIVVAPRLLMCILSFTVDFTLYKICINNNEKYKSKLLILASSYVMIVYGTRTFSNTIELILFALLQYYVCESLIFSNTLIKKREYLNYRYEKSRTVVEKVKFHKLRLFLTSDSLRNCFPISVIVVLGFFNRPTFLAFALFPVFFWLYRGIGNKLIPPMNFHLRILALILCSVPTLLFSVMIDSFYYGYLTWGEIGVLHITIDNFVFTPLNFVKYNINSSNLEKHGLHPRFLHAVINMPLLFNLLALFGLFEFLKAIYNIVRGKYQLLPTVRSIKGLMMLSYIAPLGFLSIFPHQEPRFIIPLIIPLVYLHSSSILSEADNILIKLEETPVKKSAENTKKYFSRLFKIWLVVNGIFVIFYGFFHQGGLYSAANYLAKDMKLESPRTEYHIVTGYIYSIPKTLFLQKSTDKLRYTKTTKYVVNQRVFLHEEGSLDLDILLKNIENLSKRNEAYKKNYKVNGKYNTFLIIPSSLDDKLMYLTVNHGLKFTKIKHFYPHISIEAFPELIGDLFYFCYNLKLENFSSSISDYLGKVFSSFGLSLYEISPFDISK
ncbi:Glyco transf 22 domain containing protein [Asbolus verrucosus]|uniref:Mannosyltransferase n=1 Tax=Asbolus verrucosus TaxID=1661398 RepID=A0A482VCK8_ASBVE|nr:Glyco transf 22 domain containing protein [Asbolus verrucosus]